MKKFLAIKLRKSNVIPAKAGIQKNSVWMPACAGMTRRLIAFLRFNITMAVIIFFIGLTSSAFAASKTKKIKSGSKLYKQDHFDEAAKAFEEAVEVDPNSDVANYDLGTALFKTGDYDGAVEYLQNALLTQKKDLQQKVHYNLGNAFLKDGMSKEAEDLEKAVGSVEKAVGSYGKAVELNSKDDDAAFNQKLAKKELERLKKELEKQKKSGNGKNNQDKQNQQSSQDKKSESQKSESQQSNSQQSKEQQSKDQDQTAKKNEGKEEQPQNAGQKEKDAENQKNDSAQSQAQEAAEGKEKDLSKQQAMMLLEDYENNEAPKGLLNFVPSDGREKPVAKDW